MLKTLEQVKLENGTIIRHKVAGYQGRIDGITEIKSCFTMGGALLNTPNSKQGFQYRVEVVGELMRRIAPAEDLEIVEGVVAVVCPHCHYSFHSKPGLLNKPGGRCVCGGSICPACLACQSSSGETGKDGALACIKQRQRQTRKLVARKKVRDG